MTSLTQTDATIVPRLEAAAERVQRAHSTHRAEPVSTPSRGMSAMRRANSRVVGRHQQVALRNEAHARAESTAARVVNVSSELGSRKLLEA